MVELDFRRIAPLHADQRIGFEELCCQLARHMEGVGKNWEPVRTRGAGGDAGVEFFWRLPNGDEWCWQAKYFLDLQKDQWRQLDNSVKAALSVHRRMVRYYICLPRNLTPPTRRPGKSQLEKWHEHVEKWRGWAAKNGMQVDFIRWDASEIRDRLARPEAAGKRAFWFGQHELSLDHFQAQLEKILRIVGPRYTPEVQVELPISGVFDGLGRLTSFFHEVRRLWGELGRGWSRLGRHLRILEECGSVTEVYASLEKAVDELELSLQAAFQVADDDSGDTFSSLRLADVFEGARHASERLSECAVQLHRLADERRGGGQRCQGERDHIEAARYGISQLDRVVYAVQQLAGSSTGRAADHQILIVLGNAGTGKTHLLCDVTKRRLEQGLPTVMLLGSHFRAGQDPWLQIAEQVGFLYNSRDEFLGALQAMADAYGRRLLILIDAINEGTGRDLWHDHVPGMKAQLERYPGIAVAMSCRTSYAQSLIPCHTDAVKEEHQGFAYREVDAVSVFFQYYGIDLPSAPMLPGYENPLFLKSLCKGLADRGLRSVPDGVDGIRDVFALVIKAVEENAARRLDAHFSRADRVVSQSLQVLASAMAEAHADWLTRDDAVAVLADKWQDGRIARDVLVTLLDEGLLVEDRRYAGKEGAQWVDVITFAYQAFGHHEMAARLIASHVDKQVPHAAFTPGGGLHYIVADESSASVYSGLIEALCIQLPELLGTELPALARHAWDWPVVRLSFVRALVFRRADSFTDATVQLVHDLLRDAYLSHETLDALLALTCRRDHILNADYLDRGLRSLSMPDRDCWWSYFVHLQWREGGRLEMLLDWAESQVAASWPTETAQLCAVTLAWLLTTPNRFIRDRATKALVILLRNRLELLRPLLLRFEDVDDWYVRERLYCAAYGCALTTDEPARLSGLANYVYNTHFLDGRPPAHILFRDYARGIIEAARHRGVAPQDIDWNRVRPPYRSRWPLVAPTEEELRQYDGRDYTLVSRSVLRISNKTL